MPSQESNPGPSTYMVNALTTELLDWAGNVSQIDVCPFLPHPWPWPQSLVGKSLDFLPKGWCQRPLVHINEIDGTVTFTECLRDLHGLDRPNHHSEETYPTPPYQKGDN